MKMKMHILLCMLVLSVAEQVSAEDSHSKGLTTHFIEQQSSLIDDELNQFLEKVAKPLPNEKLDSPGERLMAFYAPKYGLPKRPPKMEKASQTTEITQRFQHTIVIDWLANELSKQKRPIHATSGLVLSDLSLDVIRQVRLGGYKKGQNRKHIEVREFALMGIMRLAGKGHPNPAVKRLTGYCPIKRFVGLNVIQKPERWKQVEELVDKLTPEELSQHHLNHASKGRNTKP